MIEAHPFRQLAVAPTPRGKNTVNGTSANSGRWHGDRGVFVAPAPRR